MNWAITFNFIKGLMFGIEYCEDEEEQMFYVCIDVACCRILYHKYNGEVE